MFAKSKPSFLNQGDFINDNRHIAAHKRDLCASIPLVVVILGLASALSSGQDAPADTFITPAPLGLVAALRTNHMHSTFLPPSMRQATTYITRPYRTQDCTWTSSECASPARAVDDLGDCRQDLPIRRDVFAGCRGLRICHKMGRWKERRA